MLGANTSIWRAAMQGGPTLEDLLLDQIQVEPDGFVFNFANPAGPRVLVRDSATPANNFYGNANDFLTYTAPSTKWVRNYNGIYESGTALRCDHLANGTALGLLCEPAATNFLLHSKDFTQSQWVKSGSGTGSAPVVTANDAIAPDGTVTATRVDLELNGGTGSADWSWLYQNIAGVLTDRTFSIWLKAATPADVGKVVRLTARTLTDVTLTAEWVQYSLLCFPTTSSESHGFRLRGNEPTAKSVSVHVWNAQVEGGTLATSPIITTGSTATRAADQISKVLSALPFDAAEGQLIVEAAWRGGTALSAGSRYALQIDDGSSNNILLAYNRIGEAGYFVTSGGPSQAQQSFGALTDGQFARIGIAYELNNTVGAVNGTLGTVDTSCLMPVSPTHLRVGCREVVGSAILNGWVRRLIYVPGRGTNANLQTRTTL